jgi:RNA polymerase sigma-B factor
MGNSVSTTRLLREYHVNRDVGARERLVEMYLPLVSALARRYARGAVDYDDLVQVGSIGLIKAIDRFDLSRGGELAAYAVPNISGEIKRHLRDNGQTIRLPRDLQSDPERKAQVLGVGRPLDVADDADGFADADGRLALAGAFEGLGERERRILYLRFVRDLEPDQVAQELGISRRHLSRQTQAALMQLRRELERDLPSEPDRPTIAAVTQYVDRPYHIVLVREGDDVDAAWIARVDELPGCEARAQTADGATLAIRESMEAWISDALAKQQEIPEPRAASTHSGRLNLRMPQSLHAAVARAAEQEDVSLNQFITGSLAAAVSWRQDNHGADDPEVPAAPEPERPSRRPWLGRALLANAVLLALAAIAALALLVIVLTQS